MRAHLPIALLEQPRHDGKRKIELAAACRELREPGVSLSGVGEHDDVDALVYDNALELAEAADNAFARPVVESPHHLVAPFAATASQTRAATLPSPTMSRRRGPTRPSTIVPSAVRPTATTMASSDCSGARPHPPRLQPARRSRWQRALRVTGHVAAARTSRMG